MNIGICLWIGMRSRRLKIPRTFGEREVLLRQEFFREREQISEAFDRWEWFEEEEADLDFLGRILTFQTTGIVNEGELSGCSAMRSRPFPVVKLNKILWIHFNDTKQLCVSRNY